LEVFNTNPDTTQANMLRQCILIWLAKTLRESLPFDAPRIRLFALTSSLSYTLPQNYEVQDDSVLWRSAD
jgi:hypothetical protein